MEHDDADPDQPLIERIAAGDAQACRLLVERHLPALHATAVRLLGDRSEAEDVCQDTFLAAWKAASDWQPGRARFRSWLLRVAVNACHDRTRRRRPQEPEALDLLPSDAPGPEQSVHRSQRDARVAAALQALPERQRAAIVLCHYQGCRQDEAAGILGVSVEALESLLARGRRQLRTLLLGSDGPGAADGQ